jgi:NTE family protein
MLRAMTARGVRADVVVGASVGALNAAYYAARPDSEGIEHLAHLWVEIGRHDIYPLSATGTIRAFTQNLPLRPLRGALQAFGALNYTFPFNPLTFTEALLGRRNYLFDNHRLEGFLRDRLPVENLEDTEIPLSILTANVRNGQAVVLSRGPALPALLASTAIPGIYPNVTVGGRILMDGGVADHTTLDYAVTQRADEIYLLTPGISCHLRTPPSTPIAMALHSYNLLSEQRISASISRHQSHTRLHLLPPLCPVDVLPIDFGQTTQLIENATEATLHWLDHHEPKPGMARTLGDFHDAE